MPVIPGPAPAKHQIFLSYRRREAASADAFAWKLFEDLALRFGEHAIFYDKHSIESGTVFPAFADDAIRSCNVLLALISRDWVTVTDDHGNRRLDNPDDLVRREIALALDLGKKVIPVLFQVDEASLPTKAKLPEPLQRLADIDYLHLHGKVYEYRDQLAKLVNLVAAVPGVPAPTRTRGHVSQVAGVIPESLPYLCNRSVQEYEVREAVRTHLQARAKRPLVFVIHGQSNESHWPFVERVWQKVLPRIVGTSSDEILCSQINPALGVSMGREAFERELRYRIASEMQVEGKAERDEELWGTLLGQPYRVVAPVITIRSEESGTHGAGALRRLCDYWAALPDAPAQRLVACFLCVMYEAAAQQGLSFRLRRRIADWALRRAVNKTAANFGASAGLTWKVLPELHSIEFPHVHDWAWADEVRAAIRRDLTTNALHAVVTPGARIPMDIAIDRMRTLLTEPKGT